ncbi:MAG: ADP-forming succinate--CoA ligase subunit beta [Candidatus Hydrothermae bacterium]|nr:ADP-forming succinate--CoA ligase subunit beta [Candidatus Hydrothermae bacterium]
MKLIEYQAKEVLSSLGFPVQTGLLVHNEEELARALDQLNTYPVVLKAQVPVGGRGKAGGIKLASSREEALEKGRAILGMEIKGIPVKKLLVAVAVDIQKEYYTGIVLDRRNQTLTLMVSPEGGVDIEEVARTRPEAIRKLPVPVRDGLSDFQARQLAFWLFEDRKLALKGARILKALYNAARTLDATLVEINPLVLDGEGNLVAVDAKILLDDNALFRHPDLEKRRDMDYENKEELEAREAGLSFVRLDGNIGCCVNGAGLAMATMDVIKHYGGEPANFLDIGGSSRPEKVVKALDIILRDPRVQVIYFNIFGGITRCDDVARGLIQAFEQMKDQLESKPVVIRLTGTNEAEARELLQNSGLPLIAVETMAEGAQKAVELAGGTA